MHVLVTGGAGFIGSHVADALLERGARVRVLDDLSTGDPLALDPAVELVVGDVAEPDDVVKAIGDVDAVVHLAAHRSVLRSIESPLTSDRVNTHGTLVVLEAAREAGVRRVVAASSSSVYGGADVRPTPEDHVLTPRSPYAVSKLAGEHYCRVFTELHGIETVSLRFFNVYGPRQSPDSRYAAVIPLFIDALSRAERPTVHGDGLQSRDFTFVNDAAEACARSLVARPENCAGKAYNIAGGGAHSLLDLLGVLGRIMGVTPEAEFADPRPGDVRHTLADITAATRDLDHRPVVMFEEGLRRTVEWFRDRPPPSAA